MQMIWERQEKEGMFCFRKGLILELFKAFRRITFFLLFFFKIVFPLQKQRTFSKPGFFWWFNYKESNQIPGRHFIAHTSSVNFCSRKRHAERKQYDAPHSVHAKLLAPDMPISCFDVQNYFYWLWRCLPSPKSIVKFVLFTE